MKMQCPHCGVKGTLDDAYVGRKIQCPRCATMFLIGHEPELAADEVVTEENTPPPQPKEPGTAGTAESAGVEPFADDAPDVAAAEMAKSGIEGGSGQEEVAGVEGGNGPAVPEQAGLESPPAQEERPAAADKGAEPAKDTTGDREPPSVSIGSGDVAAPAPTPAVSPDRVSPAPDQNAVYRSRSFSLGQALGRSWDLTRGVKAPIWGGLLITYGVMLVLFSILTALISVFGVSEEGLVSTIGELTGSALSALFTAGLMYMGVKRATGRKVIWKDVFSGFEVSAKILIAVFLQMLLVTIGFVLLILPGIYLMIGYLLTFPLIIDKKMSPWQAMEASRKAIHTVWWKIFGLYLLIGLICCISAMPFGIGLIWTLPMAVILCGVVYDYLFTADKKS